MNIGTTIEQARKIGADWAERSKLESLSGWGKLTNQDQKLIREETVALLGTAAVVGQGRLRIGEHLSRVRDILEPRKMFDKYLKLEALKTLGLSRATAYRMIDQYNAARTILPPPYMRAALIRGTDKISPSLVASNPPPRTDKIEVINEYLDALESTPRTENTVHDPDMLKKEAYNHVRLRFEKLPRNARQRTAWMHSLTGMLLTLLGVSNAQSIEPAAIPEGFVLPRGRPRKRA